MNLLRHSLGCALRYVGFPGLGCGGFICPFADAIHQQSHVSHHSAEPASPCTWRIATWRQRPLNIMRTLLKFVDCPSVEALAGLGCCRRNLAVKFRWKTEVELAGVWLIRIYPSLSAVFKIFIDCGMKTLYCLRNRFSVKPDDVAGIYDPAHKNAVIEIRFNPHDISLIGNYIHGRMVLYSSTFVKNRIRWFPLLLPCYPMILG